MNTRIKEIKAHQIFDSRSNPTIEAEVILENGFSAKGAVPSGASTGIHEAVELRDGGKEYCGKGVLNAVTNVNTVINELLCGKDAANIHEIDQIMIKADGTNNKSKLGANAILAVSIACVKAAAAAYRLPLYQFIGGINSVLLPVPMMNILNGGAHADNNIDIQEFMIMPFGAKSFAHAMQMGTEIYASLKNILKQKKLSTAVGDEGGFAPNLDTDEQALELLVDAISAAGYQPGSEIKIALDAAASEWCKNGSYIQPKSGRTMTSDGLVNYFEIAGALSELQEAGHILQADNGYRITETGKQIAAMLGDDLPLTVRERALEEVRYAVDYALKKQQNLVEIRDTENGFEVECTVSDEAAGPLFSVTMYAPSRKAALTIRQNFIEKAEELLRYNISLLTGEEL